MKILRSLEESKEFWFIIITSFLFFILRFPSLFEPLWYGDEGIYQVVGSSLNNGQLLYKEIFDNKPPLLYWLYAILNSDQFTIRLASLIFGVLSVVAFFLLSKKLFKSEKKNNIPFLTTFIFTLLFALPTLEGNIANAENFMILPIILAGFLTFNAVVSRPKFSILNSQFSIFLAGLLLGIAFLFKITAIFDFAAFLVFYIVTNYNSLKKHISIPKISVGFLLPIIGVTLFFLANGTFKEFIEAAVTTNIPYVNYANKIEGFPNLLFWKLIILLGFVLYVFNKRKMYSKTTLFIFLWFASSTFNALFSQRPYTHYLLVLIPSFSLIIGLILFDKKYQKTIAIFFLIALMAVIKVFGIPKFNKSTYYYQNFISYVKGQKSMPQYQTFFDRNTPVDYEIARFIKPKLSKNDTIFIWGNNAQLYQLVGVIPPTKYIVAYHISNYKDGVFTTKSSIEKIKPKFIVVMPNSKAFPFPLINYSKKININNAEIYERIF